MPNVAVKHFKRCCLFRIRCQNCDTKFDVCVSNKRAKEELGGDENTLAEIIKDGQLHYGDPPNYGCCMVGPTMNSIPMRVLEFWQQGPWKQGGYEWERKPELEIGIDCDWAKENDE